MKNTKKNRRRCWSRGANLAKRELAVANLDGENAIIYRRRVIVRSPRGPPLASLQTASGIRSKLRVTRIRTSTERTRGEGQQESFLFTVKTPVRRLLAPTQTPKGPNARAHVCKSLHPAVQCRRRKHTEMAAGNKSRRVLAVLYPPPLSTFSL